MKILITGAAGFIGSHLCDRFISGGHDVIGADSFITGSPENVSHLPPERFRLIQADVSTQDFDPGEEVGGVLHFASPASPVDFARIPLEIMDVNSLGTRRCLELAKRYNATFLMASTSEVYGDPLTHPQKESYFGNVNPRGVRSVYDESKRFSEAMADAYHRKFGLVVRTARIFNTYGPRMRLDDGRVIPAFIQRYMQGGALTIFGDGTQTRSFCHVFDLVEGIFRLFFSRYGSPVNLGNPAEFTILELAGIMEEITGRKQELEMHPLPDWDPKKRRPDITLAREILGWEPRVPLKDGLKTTLEWFMERYGGGQQPGME